MSRRWRCAENSTLTVSADAVHERTAAMKSTYWLRCTGSGVALLVTALPSFQSRHELSADVVSIVCWEFAFWPRWIGPGRSLASHRGSSAVPGCRSGVQRLWVWQVLGWLQIDSPSCWPSPATEWAWGLVDGGSALRAIALQHQRGKALLSGFYATYTAAA